MVTAPRKPARTRLWPKEWREHFRVSAEAMADRLGVARQTVHRWERELHRFTPDKQTAYAEALGIEPAALWRRPETVSVDALLSGANDETRRRAAEIVAVLIKSAS